jgi:hypothetical protein
MLAISSQIQVEAVSALGLQLRDDLRPDRLDHVASVEKASARRGIGSIAHVRRVQDVGQCLAAAVLGDHVPGERVIHERRAEVEPSAMLAPVCTRAFVLLHAASIGEDEPI